MDMTFGICTFVLLLLMVSFSRSQNVVLDVTKFATISEGELTEVMIVYTKIKKLKHHIFYIIF